MALLGLRARILPLHSLVALTSWAFGGVEEFSDRSSDTRGVFLAEAVIEARAFLTEVQPNLSSSVDGEWRRMFVMMVAVKRMMSVERK